LIDENLELSADWKRPFARGDIREDERLIGNITDEFLSSSTARLDQGLLLWLR